VTRHTRNRQLEKLGIKGYIINVPIFVMTEHHQSEHRLDASFEWLRHTMTFLMRIRHKNARYKFIKNPYRRKAVYYKMRNYVAYSLPNNKRGFKHVK